MRALLRESATIATLAFGTGAVVSLIGGTGLLAVLAGLIVTALYLRTV